MKRLDQFKFKNGGYELDHITPRSRLEMGSGGCDTIKKGGKCSEGGMGGVGVCGGWNVQGAIKTMGDRYYF